MKVDDDDLRAVRACAVCAGQDPRCGEPCVCRAGRGHAAAAFGLGRPGAAGASARGHRRPARRARELAGTLVLADPQGYVRCSPAKARPWLPCSGRWLRSTGTGSPPPGRCPSATSQPSCGHARPPAGHVDRPRRPNRNSRPDRAAHRLRNSKGQAASVRLGRRHFPAAGCPPEMDYAHNRAMCAHSISSSARHIAEQIRPRSLSARDIPARSPSVAIAGQARSHGSGCYHVGAHDPVGGRQAGAAGAAGRQSDAARARCQTVPRPACG